VIGARGDGDTAQLYTLEGVAAAVVMLLAMTYALNAFVVTPTSDVNPGTNTNQLVAEDLLSVSEENEELKELLLNWNVSEGEFVNSTGGVYYYEGEDPDPAGLAFGKNARSVLTDDGLSYDIEASFRKPSGGTGSLTVVDNGEPGTSAVSATQTVILLDSDEVKNATGTVKISKTDKYPIPNDPSRESDVYNQATVRITVW